MATPLSSMIKNVFGKNNKSETIQPVQSVQNEKKLIQITGCPSFTMCAVPPTLACGFLRDEGKHNRSVITHGFWMGQTLVTKELFESVMGETPETDDAFEKMCIKETMFKKGHKNYFCTVVEGESDTPSQLPAEQVSWYDAIVFCNKLSIRDGKQPVYSIIDQGVELDWASLTYRDIPTRTKEEMGGNIIPGVKIDTTWRKVTLVPEANGYRLPTEMEWMWAAMGATYGGSDVAECGFRKAYAGSAEGNAEQHKEEYAWFDKNAAYKTHRVALKKANELGIFDMSGNLDEYCWDWYGEEYPDGTLTDYTGASSGDNRVYRGGGWGGFSYHCQVAERNYGSPTLRKDFLGIRLVCAM